MELNRILTRKTVGLDNRVWWVMLLMMILSTGLLSYRLMHNEKCPSLTVNIKAISHPMDSIYFTDEIISFNVPGGEKMLTWDFDEKTPNREGNYMTHIYKNEGRYHIKITTRAGCETFRTIAILKAVRAPVPVAVDISEGVISGPSVTKVGNTENFFATAKADSYEWNVLQYPKYSPRTGDSTNYRFVEPGDHIIELTLNHDRSKRLRKTIHVDDIPATVIAVPSRPVRLIFTDTIKKPEPVTQPPPGGGIGDKPQDPSPLKPIKLSGALFKTYLEDVITGDKGASDFEKYGIYGTTPVVANGKREGKNFSWLCKEINGKKKKWALGKKKTITLESAELSHINDVITVINVNFHW